LELVFVMMMLVFFGLNGRNGDIFGLFMLYDYLFGGVFGCELF